MESIDLKEHLAKLFDNHGIEVRTDNEWLLPRGELPAIRGAWFPKSGCGVVSIDVLLPDGRVINECFSGIGDGNDGLLNGLENFCVNTLHVFLSAFWDKHQPEHVALDSWQIDGTRYLAYVGNLGTRSSDGVVATLPDDLFEAIEDEIRDDSTSECSACVWYRFFVASVSGELTFEALKENQVWPKGESMLKARSWESADGYYSVRNFVLLVKGEPQF